MKMRMRDGREGDDADWSERLTCLEEADTNQRAQHTDAGNAEETHIFFMAVICLGYSGFRARVRVRVEVECFIFRFYRVRGI